MRGRDEGAGNTADQGEAWLTPCRASKSSQDPAC